MYRVVKLWSLVNTLAKNPYFFPTPQILKPLFLPFFYFRKIRSRHHRDHFHLPFCWVLSIGWGEMIFCKKVGKRGVKTWNIFDVEWSEEFFRETLRFLPCKFFWINAYFITVFEKTGKQLISPHPPSPPGGRGRSWPEYLPMVVVERFVLQSKVKNVNFSRYEIVKWG